MIADGRIKPIVYKEVYSLEQLVEGLSALEKRQTWGKAVVRVRNEKTGNSKL